MSIPPAPPAPPTLPAPPVPPAGALGPARVRPSKVWVWIGALLMVAGVVTFVVMAVIAVRQMSDDVDNKFARFVAPSQTTVSISEPGDYVIYYESLSEIDGREYSTVDGAEFAAEVRGPDGRVLNLRTYTSEISFSTSGRTGEARYRFNAATAGRYVVVIADATIDEPFVVSIGAPVLARLVRLMLLGALIGGLVFLGGLIMLIVTLVKRRRARRALTAGPVMAQWPSGPSAPIPSSQAGPPAGGWSAPAPGSGVTNPNPWTPVPPPPPTSPGNPPPPGSEHVPPPPPSAF